MSLYDLQNKLNKQGEETFTSQHERIMKEALEHKSVIEKQGQEKFNKEIKTMQKDVQAMKSENLKKGSSGR